MSPDDFKNALTCWASGVSVVTTTHQGLLYGLTVSSFSSVSLEPPLVSVCLARENRLPDLLAASRRFAVSLLARDQESVSNHFARPGREPVAEIPEVPTEPTALGQTAVRGALAHLVCEVHEVLEGGDHVIVLGRVVQAQATPEGEPLIYFRRGYRGLVP